MSFLSEKLRGREREREMIVGKERSRGMRVIDIKSYNLDHDHPASRIRHTTKV